MQILGICQVRNEDVYLNQVLANIEEFCDQVLIADHQSKDGTARIAIARVQRSTKLIYKKIRHPSEAHEMIRVYANTPSWVFPVDGDELYDPAGLGKLRAQIMRGDHDRYRQIYGHSMHCVGLDLTNKTAKGHISPPCRTVTKLYNFNAIFDWVGPCSEKCLGGEIRFKPGYSEQSNLNLMDTMSWDESPFRLLHTCFLRRSSLEPNVGSAGRLNPYELHAMSMPLRWFLQLKKYCGMTAQPNYKQERYMRGALVERDVTVFLEKQ